MVTYGDGISDVNLNKLIKFHKKNQSVYFYTVRPPARFGEVKIKKKQIIDFLCEIPNAKRLDKWRFFCS